MHKPPRVSVGGRRGKSLPPRSRSACWRLFYWCCNPCIRRVPIPGTHSRLLLASDGLWDVISPAQACRLVRGAATAQRAADLLLGMAERISNEKFGRLKDDTTVLVVDVDLRTEAMRQAAKREGSCCVVC